MLGWLAQEIQSCTGTQEICDAALSMSLKLTSASFGNVQLTDRISDFLKIQSKHGFGEAFLKAFETVHPGDCSRLTLRLSLMEQTHSFLCIVGNRRRKWTG